MNVVEFLSSCSFSKLTPELLKNCKPFKCGNRDLDDFFAKDSFLYGEKLLGKTYVFRLKDFPDKIVAAFTLSNDSVRIKQLFPEDMAKIEYVTENGEKNLRRYPGVLVGRLGINSEFAKQGIGSAVMTFIKTWFRSDENKTGCRFIIVDAVNSPDVLRYYQRNGFKFLYGSDENEAKALGINVKMLGKNPLRTRLMYYDLIDLDDKMRNASKIS
jgi:GNAT superfamily N-acetyltransferase